MMSASLGPALRYILAIETSKMRMAGTPNPIKTIVTFGISPFRSSYKTCCLQAWESSVESASAGRPLILSIGLILRRRIAHPRLFFRFVGHQTVLEGVPAAHVRDSPLIAHHHHFGAAFDGCSIIGTHGHGAARAVLRKDDFAHPLHRNTAAETTNHACHVGVRGLQRFLHREQHPRHEPEHEPGCTKTAEQGKAQHQRRYTDAVAMQQITRAAKPAEKRHQCKPVEGRRHVGSFCIEAMGVAEVDVANMEVTEPRRKNEHTEHKPDPETRPVSYTHLRAHET